MRDTLRWLHRWIGIPLGIMFFITLVTGAVTGFHQIQSNMDDRGQTYRVTSAAEDAAAIEFIKSTYPDVTNITLPKEATPYYQARNRGDRALVSIGDNQVIQEMEYSRGPVYRWMLTLHRYYHLGRDNNAVIGISGDHIVAWMSLFAVTVSLIGLYLWWPFRSKFKIKQAVPMSNKRRAYFNAHLTTGLIVVGAIVIWGLSGAALQYRDIAGNVLGANSGKEVGVLDRPEKLEDNWETWINVARAQLPEGKLTNVDFPRGAPPGGAPQQGAGAPGGMAPPQGGMAPQAGGMAPPQGGMAPPGGQQAGPPGGPPGVLDQAINFRFITNEDWLSVPNSRVYINQASSELVGVKTFGQNTFGQKLQNMINPLHTGGNISPAYVIVMVILAALAAMMIFSGVVSMLWNLLKKKREAGSVVVVAISENDKTASVVVETPSGKGQVAPAE